MISVGVVLLVMAGGLLVAGLRASDRLGRRFFLSCFALNLLALVLMAKDHPHLLASFHANPNNDIDESRRR